MLDEAIEAAKTLITSLKDGEDDLFSQVEYYEGQFEDLDTFAIQPPAAFLELDVGNNDLENYIDLVVNLNIYLCTSHMKSNAKSATYNLMDNVISGVHGQKMYNDSTYIATLYFKGFEKIGIFPGLSVYLMKFELNFIS